MTYPPPSSAPQPDPTPAYTQSSKAGLALTFSILGLLCCGILAPVAWFLAQAELSGIKTGQADPSKKGLATTALVLGIIGTVVWVLMMILTFATM